MWWAYIWGGLIFGGGLIVGDLRYARIGSLNKKAFIFF